VAHFDETGAWVAGRLHRGHSASNSLLSLLKAHLKRGKVAMDATGCCPGLLRWRCTTAGRRIGATASPQALQPRRSEALRTQDQDEWAEPALD
jgi:hypothetical protein